MKKLSKKLFDEVVFLSRYYWDTYEPDKNVLQERIRAAQKITEESGLEWTAVIYFVDSIIIPSGLLPGAPDNVLYDLISQLGWEIVDEVKESESV